MPYTNYDTQTSNSHHFQYVLCPHDREYLAIVTVAVPGQESAQLGSENNLIEVITKATRSYWRAFCKNVRKQTNTLSYNWHYVGKTL